VLKAAGGSCRTARVVLVSVRDAEERHDRAVDRGQQHAVVLAHDAGRERADPGCNEGLRLDIEVASPIERGREHCHRLPHLAEQVMRRDRGHEQRAIVVENRALELAELRRRLQAQLVLQAGSQPLERCKRLGLSRGAVERDHQLRGELFSERFRARQLLELREHLEVSPELQVGLDPPADRLEANLCEARRVGTRRRVRRQIAERHSAPENQRLVEQAVDRVRREIRRECGLDEALETLRVDRLGIRAQDVAAAFSLHDQRRKGAAQLRDVHLDRVGRRLGRVVRPERVDQRLS